MPSQTGDAAINRLQDTVADGRVANAFYRQQQLRKIQKALIQTKDTLIEALVKDSLVMRNEAFTEFYSTVSAAKQTTRHLPPVITKLLKESLDPRIVEIALSEPDRLGASLSVDQVADDRLPDTLSCPQQAHTVAIVDRTGLLQDTARSLWFARTAFGGASLYAPDIIVVNKFIKNDFLKALLTCCLENHDAYSSDSNGHVSVEHSVTSKLVGFNAKPNPEFEWIHDTYLILILIRMFPKACPPTTVISMNSYFDPHYHVRVGLALRPLRAESYLLIWSGGAVHNLFRNVWEPMIRYGDNFAQPTPPEAWALEFRQSVEDAMCSGGGPRLRRAITRLMKHPLYRDAHATDDHFMPLCFAAGAIGAKEDEGATGEFGAEDWELTNMCNSQYTIGGWKVLKA
ncbi:aromatic ring-opening dioxygenase family [Fusarium heterosporum]|uniref:Aromatic ring-opening dioxygenase family n=1 Tax=Fusarium heterosporum TaxID=42747 RepID=A0A8H5WFV2_FUSHE|nr:aromatic ring-opening dioxygenase family [Fusarium heterosporum]